MQTIAPVFTCYSACSSITYLQPFCAEFSTGETVNYLVCIISWILTGNLSEEAERFWPVLN